MRLHSQHLADEDYATGAMFASEPQTAFLLLEDATSSDCFEF